MVRAFGCLALASTCWLAGCASFSTVQSDYDKTADFSHYHSFQVKALQTAGQFAYVNDLIDHAIVQNLTGKGLQQVSQGQPDLMVRYMTQVKDVTKVGMEYIPTSQGLFTKYTPDSTTEGKMLVNVIDESTGKVVWKASTVREIDPSRQATQERIDAAIDEVFASFPPH